VVQSTEAIESCGDEICSTVKSSSAGWNGTVFMLDEKPVIRETLGHCTWTFLHSTAAYLPADSNGKLSNDVRDSFVNLVLSLRQIYACELCRKDFDKLFTDEPLLVKRLRDVSTQDDATLFTTVIHNMVSAQRDTSGASLFIPSIGYFDDHSKPTPKASDLKIGKAWWNRFVKR
jgi:hypothetical protein